MPMSDSQTFRRSGGPHPFLKSWPRCVPQRIDPEILLEIEEAYEKMGSREIYDDCAGGHYSGRAVRITSSSGDLIGWSKIWMKMEPCC